MITFKQYLKEIHGQPENWALVYSDNQETKYTFVRSGYEYEVIIKRRHLPPTVNDEYEIFTNAPESENKTVVAITGDYIKNMSKRMSSVFVSKSKSVISALARSIKSRFTRKNGKYATNVHS